MILSTQQPSRVLAAIAIDEVFDVLSAIHGEEQKRESQHISALFLLSIHMPRVKQRQQQEQE